jgi:hypothetical protein
MARHPLAGAGVPAHSRGVSENRDGGGVEPEPADLEYDLAHESGIPAAGKATFPVGQRKGPMAYVATETTEYDGDYGYDLAHDVPRRL